MNIKVCMGYACKISFSKDILFEAEKIKCGDSSIQISSCYCLDRCERAPAIMIDRKKYFDLDPCKLKEIINESKKIKNIKTQKII